jgi:hypothetical protein
LHLEASINAEAFYRVLGYQSAERSEYALWSGCRIAAVKMLKQLDGDTVPRLV